MHFSTGPSEHSYQPAMTADTTISYYWLNWRVLLCAIWILISMMVAGILIWKYEGPNSQSEEGDETRLKALGTLYDDEAWRPCLNTIHPAWLLAFRVLSFFLLLALLITNAVIDGASIFYYYTQWTFVLVTIYFGLGSLLSIYGCHQYLNKVGGDRVDHSRLDTEHGIYAAPISERSEIMHQTIKNSMFHEEQNVRKIAGLGGYAFQIICQTNAGAVMLTDCVFWFIIFPFLAIKDYDLNFVGFWCIFVILILNRLILIGMHSVNAIFLLGDTALNSMRFPWFRISYFLLWTSAYVIFQWLVHAFVSIWWPYPFLDLSSPQAPLWYLVVALMHIPCYAIFTVIIKMKHNILLRRFPQSYLNTD